ncbi:hypothetical protein EV175_006386, partial [Coemansia sp. RSA 1933]
LDLCRCAGGRTVTNTNLVTSSANASTGSGIVCAQKAGAKYLSVAGSRDASTCHI